MKNHEWGPYSGWIVDFNFLPAAPAANSMPSVLLCSPLDHISEAERGILMTGNPRSLYTLPRLAP